MGLYWLGRNFTLQVNPGGDSMTFYYYLYALERVGRLSGRRFIGEHDWYREGAERSVESAGRVRGVSGRAWRTMENARCRYFSFALLFLSKGKRQVVVGRLQYPDRSSPATVAAASRFAASAWSDTLNAIGDATLTWQTIDGNKAKLEDLLQTPVIVISGRRALSLPTRSCSSRLERLHVDQGGCILFEAEGGDGCGDASGFESSVRRVVCRLVRGIEAGSIATESSDLVCRA